MTGTTATQGYPYPLTADYADVQDSYRLATSIDADIRAEQAPFRAFEGRPSFIARQTTSGSTFLSGTQTMTIGAIDWDNTGGLVIGAGSWQQPFAQPPTWWMFGCTLLVFTSGGTNLGDMNMGIIKVNTTDQVSNVVTTTSFYQRNDDSTTGGEWINFSAMAAMYQGSASLTLALNGGTLKSFGAGSRFWGLSLGPVI
jgi:hypothetical protein